MSKRQPRPSLVNALDVAAHCEELAIATEGNPNHTESETKLSAQLLVAARMIRGLSQAITSFESDCVHMITTKVTEQMVAEGVDSREPGKYCMTCGVSVPK